MRDEILTYYEMCGREGGRQLQAGMHFHARPNYSILLMSTRPGAPYQDRWDEERGLLIYEGHDARKEPGGVDPKTVDQPLELPSGHPTQNGRFFAAAEKAAHGEAPPERVRVYEKIRAGVWSDKGMFLLLDAAIEETGGRNVCVFFLKPVESDEKGTPVREITLPHNRLIPSHVKVAVWARDGGRCVLCGDNKNLHYDHDVPFSKGGSSLTEANVRLLCAKHNLEKSDRIE